MVGVRNIQVSKFAFEQLGSHVKGDCCFFFGVKGAQIDALDVRDPFFPVEVYALVPTRYERTPVLHVLAMRAKTQIRAPAIQAVTVDVIDRELPRVIANETVQPHRGLLGGTKAYAGAPVACARAYKSAPNELTNSREVDIVNDGSKPTRKHDVPRAVLRGLTVALSSASLEDCTATGGICFDVLQ